MTALYKVTGEHIDSKHDRFLVRPRWCVLGSFASYLCVLYL